MEIDDPISKMNRDMIRATDFWRDTQAMSRLMEDSGVTKFMRETQAHAQLMEAINGPQWMRDLTIPNFDSGVTKLMREAHEQMRVLEDTGALRFMREAQTALQQFNGTNFGKSLLDIEVQKQITATATEAMRWQDSLRDIFAEPAITKLMREATANADLYRRMGLDYAHFTASSVPANVSSYMDDATLELQAIEAGLTAEASEYDAHAVAASFVRLIHTLAQLIDGEGSSVERRAAIRLLSALIPIILSLWIWHAQHLEFQEGQASSDKASQVAHHNSEAVQKALLNVADRLQQAKSAQDNTAVYRVVRPVPLCIQKKRHGESLFVLLPQTEVEAVKRDKKWLEVCAIAPDGSTQQGWILKKYLRRHS